MTKYQKHLINIIRAATGIKDDSPIPALEKKVRNLAKTAPKIIADYLDKIFNRAAKAWERGNNSGNSEYFTRCEKQSDALRDEAEVILKLWDVKVTMPGLYPCFQWGGNHYNYECARLMRDIGAKKKI